MKKSLSFKRQKDFSALMSFLNKIMVEEKISNPEWVEGYSEAEIAELESVYDIVISGDLMSFFKDVGRCFGGILGDNSLIPYRDHWTPERHVGFQRSAREELVEEGYGSYVGLGEFFFSSESDNCYDYFLRTKSTNPDLVYEYYDGEIRETHLSFFEHVNRLVHMEMQYLKNVRKWGTPERKMAKSWRASWPKENWDHLMGKKQIKFRGNMLP